MPTTPAARATKGNGKGGGGNQARNSSARQGQTNSKLLNNPVDLDMDSLAQKLLDKLQKAGSLGNNTLPDADFPGLVVKPSRGSSSSQRTTAWGSSPQNAAGGANAPAAASVAPGNPVELLASQFDTSSFTEEQKLFLASLKPKAEPTAAAGSPSKERPKATVTIQPFSDSYGKATKSLDLAKKDRDQAAKRVQDALAEAIDC